MKEKSTIFSFFQPLDQLAVMRRGQGAGGKTRPGSIDSRSTKSKPYRAKKATPIAA
jgi:hypothetical protein